MFVRIQNHLKCLLRNSFSSPPLLHLSMANSERQSHDLQLPTEK